MASIQSVSIHNPLLPLKPCHCISPKMSVTPRNVHFTLARCSTPKSVQFTEQEVLQAVADSDEKLLPGVRTYENDLAKFALVGAVEFEQALTAAAADGGQAADEHLSSGMPAMVVETLFPGHSDPHSTVSTRLFLPARKVKEKAGKLRRSISEEMLSAATSRNILSMTFRQVVLRQLWNFELVVFRPGTERDMEDLENPREVPASFSLSSSDERIISVLAEVVCISALENTERQFLDDHVGKISIGLLHWFQKPKRTVSKDSSVVIYQLFEDEIVENAKSLLKNFILTKGSFMPVKAKSKYHWWTPAALSKLEKVGGPEFSSWVSEYVPAYRLQIDANQHKDVKFEGWRKSAENTLEALLSHSQMVGLADIIDMYYEDLYTMPDKQLSSGVVANSTNMSTKKTGSVFLKMLSVTLATGIFLISISALRQLGFPYPKKGGESLRGHRSLPPSEVDSVLYQSVDAVKMEEFCISIVKKIKDALGWPGEIMMETDVGAWTGKVPNYLRMVIEDSSNCMPTISSSSEKIGEDLKASAQDIASYQVVLSTDGDIVGFQPLSSVAVNHWAANPLAKELYRGRKLSPGLTEPGLKIQRPNEVAVIELLMSVKPDACFALARPAV